MTRQDEITSLFEETVVVFERLLEPLRLTQEETEQFEERTYLWFDRFTRRPGNERVPVETFLIPLLSAARGLGQSVAVTKGVQLSVLSRKPVEIGIQLGLVREVEETPRT